MRCLSEERLLLALIGIYLDLNWLFALKHFEDCFGSRLGVAWREFDLDVLDVSDDWVEFTSIDAS